MQKGLKTTVHIFTSHIGHIKLAQCMAYTTDTYCQDDKSCNDTLSQCRNSCPKGHRISACLHEDKGI